MENFRGRKRSRILLFESHLQKFSPQAFGCAVPTHDWFSIPQKFSPQNVHFLPICGSFLPRKFPVIQYFYFYIFFKQGEVHKRTINWEIIVSYSWLVWKFISGTVQGYCILWNEIFVLYLLCLNYLLLDFLPLTCSRWYSSQSCCSRWPTSLPLLESSSLSPTLTPTDKT